MELPDSQFYNISVRLTVGKGGICTFSYSSGSGKYRQLGPCFKLREGKWIGAKAGFFATAEIRRNDSGSLDVR